MGGDAERRLREWETAMVAHCAALREVADHLASGRTVAALAKLDGAVGELERRIAVGCRAAPPAGPMGDA